MCGPRTRSTRSISNASCNGAGALAQPDTHKSRPLTISAKSDFVTVRQKTALLTIGENDGLDSRAG